jgi:hypothetical protein
MEKDNPGRQVEVIEHNAVPDKSANQDDNKNPAREPNAEKTLHTSTPTTEAEQAEYGYIKGFKLFLVITAVTLVVFLMMLDMSIIVTVSSIPLPPIGDVWKILIGN